MNEVKKAMREIGLHKQSAYVLQISDDACDKAIEALEKQIPKKPMLYGDSEDGKLLCPSCGDDLWEIKECGYNGCPYCLQAIDWSVEESKLTDNQIKFKQYLERCVLNEPCLIGDVINCEMYRNVGRVTFELSEVEMDEVVE